MQIRKLIGFCCVTAVVVPAWNTASAQSSFAAKSTGMFTPGDTAGRTAKPAASPANPPSGAALNPGYLVREVVYNELHDHDSHGYWRYWVEHHSSKETQLQEEVETPDGPVARLELTNGQPLSAQAREEDESRLERLLSSPSEQAQHRKEYSDDEHRIGRILALLPDAFLYEPAEVEAKSERMPECPCYHMHFQPNPEYPTHSIEARIFHAMAGDVWVSVDNKRLVRLDGVLRDNVDFGYGILGRLYKGGWFRLERTHVSANGASAGYGDWKTSRLEVHMAGRAMLFKTIARETSEVRGGFQPVPSGLSLQQAAMLAHEPMHMPGAKDVSLMTNR